MSTRLLINDLAVDMTRHKLRRQRRQDIRTTRRIALGLIALGVLYVGAVLSMVGR